MCVVVLRAYINNIVVHLHIHGVASLDPITEPLCSFGCCGFGWGEVERNEDRRIKTRTSHTRKRKASVIGVSGVIDPNRACATH